MTTPQLSQGVSLLDAVYSYGDHQILWESGERIFSRGWRLDQDGTRRAVLIVRPASEHLSRSSLDHFIHEHELSNELGGSWAVRPLDLVHDAGR